MLILSIWHLYLCKSMKFILDISQALMLSTMSMYVSSPCSHCGQSISCRHWGAMPRDRALTMKVRPSSSARAWTPMAFCTLISDIMFPPTPLTVARAYCVSPIYSSPVICHTGLSRRDSICMFPFIVCTCIFLLNVGIFLYLPLAACARLRRQSVQERP